MTEAELCIKLEELYADWDIYKEVPTYRGGRLDMYIKKGPLWIAVEVKKQFSTGLIFQALRSLPHSHYTYVAVPDLKGAGDAIEICKLLGIGVLIYRVHYKGCEEWQERVKPVFRRKIVPYRVQDIMKHSTAGIQHNDRSEFKITVDMIKLRLRRSGGRATIKTFFEDNKYHYRSSTSALQCIKNLCKKGKIDGLTIEGPELVLTENN